MSTPKERPKCRCGCDQPAVYLCNGFDYEPRAKDKRGKPYVNEPTCLDAMLYLKESSAEMGHPFSCTEL